MWERIVAFFMSIIAFFASLFGIDMNESSPPEYNTSETQFSYVYENLAYGSDAERQIMDLYVPKNVTNAGLILMIHGGAWIEGDKNSYAAAAKDSCETYGQFGLASATINYRYLSESISMSDILDDIDAALAKIKETAASKGVTVDKVLLSGNSAGGHLSMLYAYSRKDTAPITPAAVVNFCGPTDLLDDSFYLNSELGIDMIEKLVSWSIGKQVTYETKGNFLQEIKAVSPLYYVNENTVPTVINHGKLDTIVPYSNAVALDAKLTEYGVTHVFNTYPNSGHGLDNEGDKEINDYAYQLLLEYVQAYILP